MLVTVADKTEHTAEVTPSKALAYVKRTVGGVFALDKFEGCMVFGEPSAPESLFVPIDEYKTTCDEHLREDVRELFVILIEELALREGCKPSEVLARIAAETVPS